MDNSLEARSPPPAQPVEAPRQLPSLPTEILQRIIQLALPRLSFTTFPERYSLLLRCCLVNKLWAALAQEELYRHVGLRDGTAADLFLAEKKAVDAERSRVHSLRLRITSGGAENAVRLQGVRALGLLSVLPELSALQIVAEDEPKLDLALGLVCTVAEDLEDLTFDFIGFDPSPSESPLRGMNLRRLTLSYLAGPAQIASLLASAELPQL